MFNKLNLKIKLMGGFLIIVFILVAVGILGNLNINKINRSMNSVVQTAPLVDAAMEMKLAVARNLQMLMEMLAAMDKNELDKFWTLHIYWVDRFNTFANAALDGAETEEGTIYATHDKKLRSIITNSIQFHRNDFLPRIKKIYNFKKTVFNTLETDKDSRNNYFETHISELDREVDEIGENMMDMLGSVEDGAREEIVHAQSEADKILSVSQFQFAGGIITGIIFAILLGILITTSITKPVSNTVELANAIAEGDYTLSPDIRGSTEIESLGSAMNSMKISLMKLTSEKDKQLWMANSKAKLSKEMSGTQDIATLTNNIITCLTYMLKADIGAIYLPQENQDVKLTASYAYTDHENNFNEFKPGEGLVGQAALEKRTILFSSIPKDSPMINYGTGEQLPRYFLVTSALYEGELKGVIALGSVNEFTSMERQFAEQVCKDIGTALNAAQSREKIETLLNVTKQQADNLKSQQKELLLSNQKLEDKTTVLQESEEKLKIQREKLKSTNEELMVQQEELQAANEELEEKIQYGSI